MTVADKVGQKNLVRNVGASYVGYFVFLIFGFVMPRAISDHIGQVSLGIWDFSWSFVSYLNLSMMGIGSSVNRYVARYRTSGETVKLNRTVSTVIAIQLGVALFVLVASLLLATIVPDRFEAQLGSESATAGWVIALLGGALAVQMAFDAWRGVLTGCHRWVHYNAINVGGYTMSATLMLLALVLGGGLKALALVYLIVTFFTELLRWVIAKKSCPELRVQPSLVNKADARKVVRFGMKTILLMTPTILAIQTVSIFVVAFMGPASLAILARPLALVRHVSTLSNKFAFVLTPTAGALQSQDKFSEIRTLVLQSSRSGWLIAIPPLTFLFVLGDRVLDVWMGSDYSNWSTSAILSGGYLVSISQSPVLSVIVGLNQHGGIAKRAVILTGVFLLLGLSLATYIGWSLPIAAIVIVIPVSFGLGVTVLSFSIWQLKIGLLQYWQSVLFEALRLLATLCIALFGLRLVSAQFSPGATISIGAVVTVLIVLVLQRNDVGRVYRALWA